MAGRAEIFRSFWSYFLDFRNGPRPQIESALRGGATGGYERTKAPGAPFFPDQIKTYNNGLEWVVETFPFCAMDYILAVEGALALRGSAARLLGARHGNFAAFPFVFETADELTDDTGEAKGTAMSLWLPIWSRPAAFAELQSFILDSQARLPGREARFTAEFARAIRSQGVDAGFAGYQEFRFKMKGARVPWVCTGRYLATDAKAVLADAAELLRPLDEAGFLDQLRVHEKDGRAHRRLLSRILEAVEDAVSEGEPHRYLAILECLFEPTRLLATSKRFREAVRQPVQSPPLPQQPWLEALRELEAEPEFEIARAVASIVGHARRSDGRLSDAEAFLGSILPLKLAGNRRYLPDPLSPQAVWSGSDLCLDLARVLARRYHDSRTDDVPALNSAYPARLVTVLRFLHSELDDTRIARYIEALSLINWSAHREASRPRNSQRDSDIEEPTRPIPLAYAAIRSLLETELGQRAGDAESRRCVSVRTLALLRERSRSGVAAATVEALQRLSIYGVPNPYGVAAQVEKPNLVGRDIVRIAGRALVVAEPLAARLAAAVCVPLRWHDRFALFRAVTLPQIKELKENI
jgi:CRISPR-associated protein Csx17